MALVLAAALLSGCGASLYDAQHLPVRIPACTTQTEPIACVGAPACVAEDDSHCGTGCADCIAQPIQHGSVFCDRSSVALEQHVCATNCEPGFVRDPSGPGCICGAGEVACGAAGTCVVETAAACGASCQACSAPAGASPTCSNHGCDYLCPGGKVQCPTAAGQPDCCTPACSAQQIQCGSACVSESAKQCGPRCADCTSNAVPANATAACLGPAGQGVCTFACKAGFLKSNGACVQVAAGPGSVALGATHTCVVTTKGGVMCWGNNGAGQLGVGDTQNRLTPVDVPLAGGAAAAFVAAGTSHTCAVTTAGAVQCWGSNATAQLGLLLTATSLVPAVVPGLTSVTAVAAGAGHTCALQAVQAGGAVLCWGANDKLQAGANPPTTQPVTTPTAVNLSGATGAIATQLDHTCALKQSDGHVMCWGSNVFGQTGQSPSPSPTTPGATVSGLVATSIAVGGTHTCAIGTFNNAGPAVYCWGDRSSGQLGDGLITPAVNTPQPAARIAPAAGAADRLLTGRAHTCDALGSAGTVTCAGANLSLQVGKTPPSSSELQGPGLAVGTVDALVGGGDHSCALSAGALACWGANDHGQLGNGSTNESAVPVAPQPF